TTTGNFAVSSTTSADRPTLFVDSQTGRVGIGTMASTRQISVGTGNVEKIISFSEDRAFFGYSGALVQIGSGYNKDINFYTNYTSIPMVIKNTSGLVGIGTTAPGAMLHASTTNESTTGIMITHSGTSPTANFFELQSQAGTFLSGFTASGGLLMNIASTTAFVIQDGSGNTKFVVDSITGNATSTGRLVIGTTQPTNNHGKIWIGGDVYNSGNSTTTGTLQVVTSLATGTAQPNSTTTANFGGNVYIQGNSTTTGNFAVSSTTSADRPTLFVNSQTGNVGIGTTTPSHALTVNGSLKFPQETTETTVIKFFNSGSAGISTHLDGSIYRLRLRSYDNTEIFMVDSNNIYFGKLSYTPTFAGTIRGKADNSWGMIGTYYRPTNTGHFRFDGSTDADEFQFQDWTAVRISDPVIIDGSNNLTVGGNVGIGTTAPGAMLHASTTNESTTGIMITHSGTSPTANFFELQSQAGTFLSGFTASGGLLMNIASSTAFVIQDGSGNTKFVVDSITGNATSTGNLTLNSANPFIQWTPASAGNKLSFQSSTTTLASLDIGGSWITKGPQTANSAPDYAEYILSKEDLEDGDLVAVAPLTLGDGEEEGWGVDFPSDEPLAEKAQKGKNEVLIGIITSGSSFQAAGYLKEQYPDHAYLMTLSGRVPVKVSLENGEIKQGDYLTFSSLPGAAAKAISAGPIIGTALGDFNGDDEETGLLRSARNDSGTPRNDIAIGKVLVLVHPGHYAPPEELKNIPLTDFEQQLKMLESEEIKKGIFAVVLEKLENFGIWIQNGLVKFKEIVTDKFFAKKARIEKLEMVDQATGEIYCTWVENGEWVKIKGECGSLNYESGIMNQESGDGGIAAPPDSSSQ
ncbi:MAG: Uncharacterized protein Athens071412_149, partial [Parcubacteria group bacterium Athens0714_12]